MNEELIKPDKTFNIGETRFKVIRYIGGSKKTWLVCRTYTGAGFGYKSMPAEIEMPQEEILKHIESNIADKVSYEMGHVKSQRKRRKPKAQHVRDFLKKYRSRIQNQQAQTSPQTATI